MIFDINNSISNYKIKQEDNIQKEINSISDDLLLKTDETTLLKKLKETYKINHIKIEIDKREIISDENISFEEDYSRENHCERFSILFNKNDELILKIPYLGDKELFDYCPTSYIMPKNFIKIKNNYVVFKVIFQKNNTNSAKLEIDNYCNYLTTMVKNLNKDIDTINNDLNNFIKRQIKYRKKELNEKNKFLDELNIPLSKPKDKLNNHNKIIPFNIKDNISVKEDISSKSKSYTLSYDNYNQILKTIHKYCINIEQKLLSKDKNEEEIRDLILAHLNSVTDDASVTGESFNNKGKTDILIRYEEKNLFIGECKIWYGKKKYLEAINQLLSYLTWRDTLAALIIFVRNENMENIISKIKEYTKEHPNYVSQIEQKDKDWINYKFYLDLEDKEEIYLAVQIFKTP